MGKCDLCEDNYYLFTVSINIHITSTCNFYHKGEKKDAKEK